MDIVVWLRSLGLERYEAAFRENEIDETVLPGLTAEDLKELGVTALGHRRKLLDAIAALRAEGGLKAPSPAAAHPERSATSQSAAPVAEAIGERRHLTVMFCDLVGSTSMSAALDAEDWRDLVSAYLDAASAAVMEMGGHVAKKLGDGLMALFGYPAAQENDAERAARAALLIQLALAEVNRKNAGSGKPPLTARIGIETGPVVVDAADEIYGDAPNVAARVQALAEPGMVLVTAQVQRQIAGLFVAEERGSHHLKGVPEPVPLFRLVRASGGGRRAGQRHLTPLVGREEEIATLMRRWERARQGDGQLVLIVGEPGLGKSRLMEEFHARLREVPHTWTEWSCSQLLRNTPLHPGPIRQRSMCMSTRLREHEKRLQKARAALLVGGGVDPTIALDSLAVLEETMRHFVFKARALEEEMALRANKGEEADFGAVDKARAEAGRWAKEVAEYRHAKISAVKLAGDPNVVMPDNMTLDQLREAILSDVARLADVLELDAESIRLPQGVENRLPVAPSNGGED